MKLNTSLCYTFKIIGNNPLVVAEISVAICCIALDHLPLSGSTVWFSVKKLSFLFP